MTRILVFAEISGDKEPSDEIISYCMKNFQNAEINAAVFTTNNDTHRLSATGLDNLYLLINENFLNYSTEIYKKAAVDFLKTHEHDIVLIPATPSGRDLAPGIASALNAGLTADCTEISLDEDNLLNATRPTYGGKLMATILSKTTPQFATIRPGALKFSGFSGKENTKITEIYPEIDCSKLKTSIISYTKKQNITDWANAQIIVAGGRGLGSKENFDLIYKLCEKIDAQPAASRCAVELGWADKDIQIGQTGSSVSPKLYIAFGISGAMQHIVGIENADRIIAVNTDRNAPIMKISDVSIPADAVTVLKTLINEFYV